MNKIAKSKYIKIIVITAAVFLFQKLTDRIGWKTAFLFDVSGIDKDGTFFAVSVHHIIIAALALLAIFLLHRYKKLGFGIKPVYDSASAKITAVCCGGYLIYYVIWYAVIGFRLNAVSGYGYELNALNVIGTLCFQLLLSGTAEELIFRAIPVTLLISR